MGLDVAARGVLGVLVVQGAPGGSGIFHQPPARAHPQSRLLLLDAVPSLGFIFASAPHFGLVPCPFSGLVLLLCFCHDKNSRGGAKIALRRLNMQMLPACPGASSVSAGPLGALHCCGTSRKAPKNPGFWPKPGEWCAAPSGWPWPWHRRAPSHRGSCPSATFPLLGAGTAPWS